MDLALYCPTYFILFVHHFQIILDRFPKLYCPSTIMSSLVTKWKKNKPYLYWVRSARVQGKPRIVEQIYLGPRERVLEQLRTQGSVAPQPGPPRLCGPCRRGSSAPRPCFIPWHRTWESSTSSMPTSLQ